MPKLIYPLQLVRSRRTLRGRVTLARMHRLRPLLAEADMRDARVDLAFGLDDSGRPGIRGTVRADLNLICQRCLKTVPFPARSEVRLNIIISADGMAADGMAADGVADYPVERVAPGFEPLMVREGEAMALSDLIEDELLLALPIAPMHTEGACSISKKYSGMKSRREKRENPFSVLVDKPTHSNYERQHGCSAETKIQRPA